MMALEVTGRQHCSHTAASAFPRHGGRKSRNCFGTYKLLTNHGTMVCVKSPVGRFQESPALLGSAGQARTESRDFPQQFPKPCSHCSCPSWQGGRAPGDGAVPVLPVRLPQLLVCRFFCQQLHLLALGGLLLCPVTTLSPVPSLFCCHIPPPAPFGRGTFPQSISSSFSAFSSSCSRSFLTSSVLWAEP